MSLAYYLWKSHAEAILGYGTVLVMTLISMPYLRICECEDASAEALILIGCSPVGELTI